MSTITDECFCNHKSFKDKMTNGRCLCHVPLKHWNSQNPSNFSVNLSHPTFTGRQDGYFCATLGAEEAGETIAPCSELLPLLFVIVTHSLPLLFVIATHPLPLPLLFVIGTHPLPLLYVIGTHWPTVYISQGERAPARACLHAHIHRVHHNGRDSGGKPLRLVLSGLRNEKWR